MITFDFSVNLLVTNKTGNRAVLRRERCEGVKRKKES